jgi:hypothetical protein
MLLYEASSHLPDLLIDPCKLTCKTQLHYETQHNPANYLTPVTMSLTFTCFAIFHTGRNETC